MPKFEYGKILPEKERSEKEFFNSLSTLTTTMGIEMMDYSTMPYPYNILLSFNRLSNVLESSQQEIRTSIIEDEFRTVGLCTDRSYEPGTTLYYIPVLPVFQLLRQPKKRKSAELLLSVFAYLYHHAGIPYFRDEGTYLYYQYEYMNEWLQECLEEEEKTAMDERFSELNHANHFGDVMHRKIYNRYHLQHFQQRIDSFIPMDEFDWECLNVALLSNKLMIQYPGQSILRNMENEELDYDDGVLRAEQYISFIASTEGNLYESIQSMLNTEFGEYGEMEKPTLQQVFNENFEHEMDGLDFEYKLFALITDLCTLLNSIS